MFGGINLGFGKDEGGASPNMLVMIAGKALGAPKVDVSLRFVRGSVSEQDFIELAAAVLQRLRLHASEAAQAAGQEPIQLGRFADKTIDLALDIELQSD